MSEGRSRRYLARQVLSSSTDIIACTPGVDGRRLNSDGGRDSCTSKGGEAPR